jgi:hypothetical protein
MGGVEFKKMNWLPARSAWNDMEYYRVRRAAMAQQDLANMDSVNSAMATAMQTNITGASNNAANAALKRIQAVAKAKNAATIKQLDNAERLITQTKASLAAATPATPPSTSVVDTIA